VCAFGLVIGAWAQPGGGMPSLEADWALLCFELKVEGKILEQLRAAYQGAWDQRRELAEEAREGGMDRALIQEKMGPVQADLDKALRQFLTKEQFARLEQLRAQRREFGPRGGPRRQ
jgi:hypothetical protein